MGTVFPLGGAAQITQGQGPYLTTLTAVAFSNPFAKTWFVDPVNGSDGNAGNSSTSAFKTISQAISASLAGDTIVLGPGTYTLTAALAPKANQTFIAAILKPRAPTVVIVSSAIATLVDVEVNGCSFIGIEFKAGDNTCTTLMGVGTTAAVVGLNVESCVFNGNTVTAVQGIIASIAATFAVSRLAVHGCLFFAMTGTACINLGTLGAALARIWECQFDLDNATVVGVKVDDTGAVATGKGWVIEKCSFVAFAAASAVQGITIVAAGGNNTSAFGIMRDNDFSNFAAATAITTAKATGSAVENFVGVTGGALATA